MTRVVQVASVMVSSHGFRERSWNEKKICIAEKIASICKESGVQIVALPAGFLIAKNDTVVSARRTASLLTRGFARRNLSVMAGVDLPEARSIKKKGEKRYIREERLPYFVFASNSSGNIKGFYRQRCTRSDHDALLPAVDSLESRIVKLKGLDVALLACGEIHSKKIRHHLSSEDCDLVVNLGHCGLGRGFQSTIPKLAEESGAYVINAQHFGKTRSSPSRKWCAPRRGQKYLKEEKLDCGLRAELVCWNIPRR